MEVAFPEQIFYHGEVSAKTGENVNKVTFILTQYFS